MKHRTDWLIRQTEATTICRAIKENGYTCRKRAHQLAFNITKGNSVSYLLTYIPSPVSEWTLLPKDNSNERETLLKIIKGAK